ncbi:hypothetical protein JHK86_012999 [Glycine max]|nr:hypothetical protein JHK86_012999 [Glycine max]
MSFTLVFFGAKRQWKIILKKTNLNDFFANLRTNEGFFFKKIRTKMPHLYNIEN